MAKGRMRHSGGPGLETAHSDIKWDSVQWLQSVGTISNLSPLEKKVF